MLMPLEDRVLLEEIEYNKTKSGIILDSEKEIKSYLAKVVAVGNKVDKNITVGSTVAYAKFTEVKVLIEGKEYLVCRNNDILAIIEE